jgi:hypothetical protein
MGGANPLGVVQIRNRPGDGDDAVAGIGIDAKLDTGTLEQVRRMLVTVATSAGWVGGGSEAVLKREVGRDMELESGRVRLEEWLAGTRAVGGSGER